VIELGLLVLVIALAAGALVVGIRLGMLTVPRLVRWADTDEEPGDRDDHAST